jgi:hypothetical protein
MKRFIRNITLVLFPFFIYMFVPAATLFLAGEVHSFEAFTEIHNTRKDACLGMAYSGPERYMKLHSIIRRKPEIIVMGNSRVLAYRNFFFRDSNKFYNGGATVARLKQYKYFLELLPDTCKPKVIIMSVDHNFFNRSWDSLGVDDFGNEYKEKFSFSSYLLSNTSLIWKDYRAGKISPLALLSSSSNQIGMTAAIRQMGYRYDGSYYYGVEIPADSNSTERFDESFKFIRNGIKRFEYADSVNPEAFLVLDSLLRYCRQHNIKVIGFLPTYAHCIYQKMKDTGKYRYTDGIYEQIQPYFAKHNYSFYDFTDIHVLGATDAETLDGYHISEKACLRLLTLLTKREPVLQQYTDTSYLQSLLQNAYSPYQVLKGQ